MTDLFDPINGRLKQAKDDYTATLQGIDAQETQQKAFIDKKTQQLQAQFAQMERTLSQLQSASSALGTLALTLNPNSGNGSSSFGG